MGTLRFFEEVVSFKIRRTFGFADYNFFLYLFGIMFFLMFYSQYGYYKKQGDWAQELCAPHPYWYIFFGVCLWIAAFGIILKKCLE